MSDLTVLLPTYNEEEVLGKVIDEIKALPVDCNILVVDNNSTDDSYNVAIHKGATVVSEPRQGKGYAVRKGLEMITTPYTIMLNSDFTYPAAYIPGFYEYLKSGYEVVVGYRRWKDPNAMSSINSFGNKMLSLLASKVYGKKIFDVCSGLWGFSYDFLDKICLRSGGFTLEVELFSKVVKHNVTVFQTPIVYRARPNSSKTKLRIVDGFKIGWYILNSRRD